MNEAYEIELQLIEKSILALKQAIKDLVNLDMHQATEMYNTVLAGFEGLQKKYDNDKSEGNIMKTTLLELKENHKKVIGIFENGDLTSLSSIIEKDVLSKYIYLQKHLKEKIFLKKHKIVEDGKYYKMFKESGHLKDMNTGVMEEIQSYWKKYYKKEIDPSTHLAYYNQTGKIEPRIIPQVVLNMDIIPILNGLDFNGFYSDKNVYDLLIGADSAPEVVLKRVNGQYFNPGNETISRTEAFRLFFSMEEDLIIKESRSDDGKSVEKLRYRGHGFYFNNRKVDLRYVEEHWGRDFIIQKVLRQHPIMAAPHKYSVNTLRMVTLRWNNDIHYLMTYARFGANKQIKDNGSQGGIIVALSSEGKFSNFGMDHNASTYKNHPTTGFKFEDQEQIPNFNEYIDYVKKLHNRILHHNYVSWDIAMGLDGKPIFIEMNFRGPVWLYQFATEKPIFGEFTEEILEKAVEAREERDKKRRKVEE